MISGHGAAMLAGHSVAARAGHGTAGLAGHGVAATAGHGVIPGGGGGDGLSLVFADEFDGAAGPLDPGKGWQTLNVADWAAAPAQDGSGRLILECDTSGVYWYLDVESGFLYQEMTGDGLLEMRCRVSRRGINRLSAPSSYQFAGPMMLDPVHGAGQKNYVFQVLGLRADPTPWSLELKNTTNSANPIGTPFEVDWAGTDTSGGGNVPWADMRITRVGEVFTCHARNPNDESNPWVQTAEFTRPDLPSTLWWGAVCYAFYVGDILAEIEYVRMYQ